MKIYVYIIFLLPSLAIAQAEKDSLEVVPPAVTLTDTVGTPSLPERVLELAKSFIGTPYKYGSNATNQFDCSGFVRHCYGSCRVELPHGSGSQAQLCDAIALSEVKPGDLLFFKGRNAKSSHIGHVAMVLDTSDGKIRMIHATTHGGVMVDVYNDSAYYTSRFVKAGRLKPHIVSGIMGQTD